MSISFDTLLWLGCPILVAQIVLVMHGMFKLKSIDRVPVDLSTPPPGLTVVIAARNEAVGLPRALEKLAAIPGDWIEFVLVNDRSTDATGVIAQAFARRDPRFKIIEVRDLPPHWLGKNHALARGVEAANMPWLLFTDADVLHSEIAIRRALHHAEEHRLDLLALLIDIKSPSQLVQLFISFFAFSFTSYFRPWLSSNPKSKAAVGIGAFNLVRKSFYALNGGHAAIAMRPDDDVMLAKHLKRCGGKLDVMVDIEHTSVEWYPTFWEAARGLEKNSLAGLNYSYALWAASLIGCTTFYVLAPLWGLWTLSPIGLIYYIGTNVPAAIAARQRKQSAIYAYLYPLGAALFVFVVLRAGVLTMWRGGIIWRGHFYRLRDLKENKYP